MFSRLLHNWYYSVLCTPNNQHNADTGIIFLIPLQDTEYQDQVCHHHLLRLPSDRRTKSAFLQLSCAHHLPMQYRAVEEQPQHHGFMSVRCYSGVRQPSDGRLGGPQCRCGCFSLPLLGNEPRFLGPASCRSVASRRIQPRTLLDRLPSNGTANRQPEMHTKVNGHED
jgi:hypothetical protein